VTWWGLLLFVAGGQIGAMTETTALIKSVRAMRQTVRRMDHGPEYHFLVPVWEAR
jgi:hypothetical protein